MSFRYGVWVVSHLLRHRRMNQASWPGSAGLQLLGGAWDKRSTEIIKPDGTSEEGFQLSFDTRLML